MSILKFQRCKNINNNIYYHTIMTHTISYDELYKQLKGILDGCDTLLDGIPFLNYYVDTYPDKKNFIINYINSKRYNDNIDIKTKQSIIYDVYMSNTKNKALNIIYDTTKNTLDQVYKNTLNRISNTKDYIITRKYKKKIVNIQKKCPHKKCGHIISMPKDTQYVICGYTDTKVGYDWNGCGRDWCFKCEKILCKSWEEHKLHIVLHRHHTTDCCKKHAKKYSYKYPDNYCRCYNENIDNYFNSFIL